MPKVVILFTDPSPLWYESIRHTFILAHHVTPLKGGWVHSIRLGREPSDALPETGHSARRTQDHRPTTPVALTGPRSLPEAVSHIRASGFNIIGSDLGRDSEL